MLINKTWLAMGAGVSVLVVAGAVAVGAADWGGVQDPPSAVAASARHSSYSGGGGNGGGRGTAAMSLLQFDANKDGQVTRAEIEAGLAAEFHSADSNGDGRLDATEYQKFVETRRAERKARLAAWRAQAGDSTQEQAPPSPASYDTMKRIDWNLDGYVTPDEFGGRVRALAMRADRDGNGTVSAEEMQKSSTGRGRRANGDQPRVAASQ